MENIVFFGETTFRNKRKRFGIKNDDRRRHFYVIGKTGVGKTSMMEGMAIQDFALNHGTGFIDPHGEAAENLLNFIPPERINDVVYFNPADLSFPIAFNVMENVNPAHRHLVSSGLMGVFKKIWPDVWSARMEYILNNAILALLEYPESTLLGINRILSDADFRKKVIDKVNDPVVKAFWVNEYSRYSKQYESEATAAIQNKIGQFISNPLIRNIVGQVKSTIDIRKIMDEGKIFVINISKGRIGEDNSKLLGSLVITKLQLAAMSRVDTAENQRKDFYLYVDEFQNFATSSFVTILSEARKYRLSLILGHQYISQMEEPVSDAVFGNIGTIVSFRIGADDADFLEKEFAPEFNANDLVNLPKYNSYVKLMIDGITSKPFSAETLNPSVYQKKQVVKEGEEEIKDKIIRVSRERYGIPRDIVEDKIIKWFKESSSSEVKIPNLNKPLYDAVCSICGKKTKVIFEPEEGRPIYCKNCRNKKKKETSASIENKPKEKTILFSSLRKNKGKEEKAKKPIEIEKLKNMLKNSLDKKND